jgi:hypothetical protein
MRPWRRLLHALPFLAAAIAVGASAELCAQPPAAPPNAPTSMQSEQSQAGASSPSEKPRAASAPARKKTDPRVARWIRTLYWSLVLIVILLFAAIAIVVFSRRYRAYLLRGRQKPTPSDDIWAMHKLPPDSLSDSDSPPDP